MDAILGDIANWLNYNRINARFERGLRLMYADGVLAIVGVAAWVGALASSSPSPSPVTGTAVPASSTIGTLTRKSNQKVNSNVRRFRMQLKAPPPATLTRPPMQSKTCDSIGVINLGGSGSVDDPWHVTVLPDSACPKVNFTVDNRQAAYTAMSLATAVTAVVTVSQPLDGDFVVAGVFCAMATFLVMKRFARTTDSRVARATWSAPA